MPPGLRTLLLLLRGRRAQRLEGVKNDEMTPMNESPDQSAKTKTSESQHQDSQDEHEHEHDSQDEHEEAA